MANTISKFCNNRFVVIVAVCVFLVLIGGTGYLYFQKYFGPNKVSKESPKDPEKPALTEEIKRKEPTSDYEFEMIAAGKAYWADKYGQDGSEVILRDAGCHVGLEVVREGASVGSLIYDGTKITEIEK